MSGVEVPDSVDEALEPTWLSRALSDIGPDERVVSVERVDELATVASKVRFEVAIEGGSGGARRSAYCLKVQQAGPDSGSGVEAFFYRDLAPRLDVRTPNAYYAGVSDDGSTGMIIMDDIHAIGGRFMTAHEPYTVETTRDSVGQLARLHGATWDGGVSAGLDWLKPGVVAALLEMFPLDMLQGMLDDGRADGLAPELRDAETVVAAVREITGRAATCVIHADTHSGNMYLAGDGRGCWLDWQLVQPGHWATDVAYHLATVLDVETRREHEQALLRHYLASLAEAGGPDLDWEESWDLYRTSFGYGYFLWSITRISSREVVMIHVPRLGAALTDHDSLARLGVV